MLCCGDHDIYTDGLGRGSCREEELGEGGAVVTYVVRKGERGVLVASFKDTYV